MRGCRLDSHKSDQWRALANTLVKKWVALNTKNFLNSKETVYLSRRVVLFGVSKFVKFIKPMRVLGISILSFLLTIH